MTKRWPCAYLPLLAGESCLRVTGKWESAAYVCLTENALRDSGIAFEKKDSCYTLLGGQSFALPAKCAVEGDWSNAAFWLCAGALLEKGLTVTGLRMDSAQGDKEVIAILRKFGAHVEEGEVEFRFCMKKPAAGRIRILFREKKYLRRNAVS
mgnify:CR=1 FL=1